MHRLLLTVPTALLAACASNQPQVSDTPGLVDPSQYAAAATTQTIDISELDNGMVCERRVPTGTRISEEVCFTRQEYRSAQAEAERQLMMDDLREMRDREMYRQQAEQAARAAAFQRAMQQR